MPSILAVFDYWYRKCRRASADNLSESNGDSVETRFGFFDRENSLVPAVCLTFANVLQPSALAAPRSTYICPLSSTTRANTLLVQLLAVLLDCYILFSSHKIFNPSGLVKPVEDGGAVAAIGHTFLVSSMTFMSLKTCGIDYMQLSSGLCFTGGTIALIVNSVYWVELSEIGWSYAGSIAWASMIFTVSVIAALHVVSHRIISHVTTLMGKQSVYHSVIHLSMFVLTVHIFTAGFSLSWTDLQLLPVPTPILAVASLLLLFVGAAVCMHTVLHSMHGPRQPSKHLAPRLPLLIYGFLGTMLVFLGWFQFPQPRTTLPTHPVEMLMDEASKQAKDWLDQASRSETLAETVQEYRRRYQHYPPPGFDAWYRYATERSSIVIDDFDSMMDDLKPFWGISPGRIRELTREVISDPWNEVSEVKVRNGHARLGPNFLPTHRWMLDGVIALVEGFSHFLPDMDVAFNLNDEPRVAVPFRDLQKLRAVHPSADNVHHRWSPKRAMGWEMPEDSQPSRLFEDHSRTNAFDEGSLACPPSSYAQKAHTWDSSALCTSCAVPHSHGVFLSNWTLSASPCHQPDLRHLHGFYLSPAAFKPSHELLPIFSQSKVEGYADILYPSPWNYMDKIKYDPDPDSSPDLPFAQKDSTLFWRGATSEGVSRAGTWKGMTRQRLVHLANNLTMDPYSPTLPILLPHPSIPGRYAYQTLTSNPISALNLSLDISIVNGIARAWDNDGAAQDAEFGFAPPTDFQEHWRYRYLFDMDGAGFSGRFLPFLQSRSLPFRTGIFRSWWDGRLTAWKHFVPVDVRLHGLFSTLIYFMGAASTSGSVEGIMKENVAAGEEIAEAGRLWSERVLRKEDMEIYMFRLLLEWGRLTDDDRDKIGFTG